MRTDSRVKCDGFPTFQELRPHLQGVAGGLEAPKLTTGCQTPLQDLWKHVEASSRFFPNFAEVP